MKIGNFTYRDVNDIPASVPVFPLSGALLLPGSQMPLNLFEPRYLSMFDAALSSNRLVGMIQPAFGDNVGNPEKPNFCKIGCIGRIVSFSETGDGRYVITLHGVARFRVIEELPVKTLFRQCRIAPFASDLDPVGQDEINAVNRDELLGTFKEYLAANELEADWESVRKADNETLVNSLSMMSPYGPAEKQALLEAQDLKTRSETLVAITQMLLVRDNEHDYARTLQ